MLKQSNIKIDEKLKNVFFRRERNICQICWAKTAQGDFETSSINTAADGKALLKANCCNYGTALDNQDTAYDCAIIPGASKATDGASINIGKFDSNLFQYILIHSD